MRGQFSIYRCRNISCKHIFCYPQPNNDQLAAFYDREYYGGDHSYYTQTQVTIFRQILEWLPKVRKPFLDVGCGDGLLYEALPAKSRKYYTGVEPNKAARESAKKRTGCHIAENLAELDTLNQVFKVVVVNQVIEHFRNPVESLKMIGQVSSIDTIMLIATANSTSLKAIVKGSNWDQIQNRTHLHMFTKKSLVLALQKGGWPSVETIADTIKYPHHGTMRRIVHLALRKARLDGNLTILARK